MWTTGYKTADLEIQCVWHKDQLLHKELWLTLTEIIETDKAGNGTTLLPNVSPALVLVMILKHATYCYRCPIYIWGFSARSDSTLIRISKDNKQIHTVHWAEPVSLNRDVISSPLLYSLKCMEIARVFHIHCLAISQHWCRMDLGRAPIVPEASFMCVICGRRSSDTI